MNKIERLVDAHIGDDVDASSASVPASLTAINAVGNVDVAAHLKGSATAVAIAGSGATSNLKPPTPDTNPTGAAEAESVAAMDAVDDNQSTDLSQLGTWGFNFSGAVAVNTATGISQAYINDTGTITTNAAVKVISDDESQYVTVAGGIGYVRRGIGLPQGTALGLAGAFSVNDISNTVQAFIVGANIHADSVEVAAERKSKNQHIAVAVSGEVALNNNGNAVAVAGGVTINLLDNTTKSYVQNAAIETAGTVAVSAADNGLLAGGAGGLAIAKAIGPGAKVNLGLGSAVAYNRAANETLAQVDGSTILHGGAFSVEATNAITAYAFALSAGVSSIAVSGTGAANIIASNTQAKINNSKNTRNGQRSTGNVKVSATDDASVHAGSGGIGLSGTLGLGIAVSKNVLADFDDNNKHILQATITDSELDTSGSITVKASSSPKITGWAIGAAGSLNDDSVNLAGSFAVNSLAGEINAKVENSSLIASSIDVSADDGNATDKARIISVAGGVALNLGAVLGPLGAISESTSTDLIGASVGAGFSINDIDISISATITGGSATTTAGDLTLSAANHAEIKSVAFGGALADSISIAGAIASNEINPIISARIEGEAVVSVAGDISVKAENAALIDADAGGVALAIRLGNDGDDIGSLSVGGSIAVNSMLNQVSAGIDTASVYATGDIAVSAKSDAAINALSIGGTLAGAFTQSGLNGSFTGTGSGNDILDGSKTEAFIKNANAVTGAQPSSDASISATSPVLGQVIAGGNVSVHAQETPHITADAGGVAIAAALGADGLNVSLGIAAARNDINVDVLATVDNSTLYAASVDVRASTFADESTGTRANGIFDYDPAASAGLNGALDNAFQNAEDHATINAFALGGAVSGSRPDFFGLNGSGAGAGVGNTISNAIDASITNNSVVVEHVDDGAGVTVSAIDAAEIIADAGGVGLAASFGSGLGINLSIGVAISDNDIHNTVSAVIDNSIVTASDAVRVNASEAAAIKAFAIGFAGAGGVSSTGGLVLSGAGAGTYNTIGNTVAAYFKDATISASGTIDVKAKDVSIIFADAGGAALSVAVGATGSLSAAIGGSEAINTVENSALALINNSAVTATNGSVNVDAHSDATINAIAIGATASVTNDMGALAASGAGAGAYNRITNSVLARIENGSSVRTNSSGAVLVWAHDTSYIYSDAGGFALAVALSGAGAGSLSVGFSHAEHNVNNTVHAAIDDANFLAERIESGNGEASQVIAADGITVKAEEDADIIVKSMGGAPSGVYAGATAGSLTGAGAGSFSDVDNDIQAFIRDGNNAIADDSEDIQAGGELMVEAIDNVFVQADAGGIAAALAVTGGAGAGAVSIGLAIARNEVTDTVRAYIEGASVNAGGINIKADAVANIETLSFGGAASIAVSSDVAGALTGSGAVADTGQATSENDLSPDGLAGRDGIGFTVESYIVDSAKVLSAGDVDITASNKSSITSDVVGGSLSVSASAAASLAGAISAVESYNTIKNTVRSYIHNSDVTLLADAANGSGEMGNLTIAALNESHIDVDAVAASVAVAVSLDSIGLSGGGSGTYNTVKNTVEAFISTPQGSLASRDISAAGFVSVKAEDGKATGSQIYARTGVGSAAAGSIAGASIGASVSKNLIDNTVTAYIDAKITTTNGDVSVLADSKADIDALTVATSVAASVVGAFAGAGGDTDATINSSIDAYLGTNADVSAVGNVNVEAKSHFIAQANATSVSVTLGLISLPIGVSLGDAEINGHTKAYVLGAIKQATDVLVEASNISDADSSAVGVAGGLGLFAFSGAGAEALANVNTVIDAYIDNAMIGSAVSKVNTLIVRTVADTDADASAEGTAVALGIGAAAAGSVADAKVTPSMQSYLSGAQSEIYVSDDLLVESLHNYVVDGDQRNRLADHRIEATTVSPSVGLVSGAGADSEAIATPEMDAYIGNVLRVDVGDDLAVFTLSYADVNADAVSVAAGLVSGGGALATGTASGVLSSRINGDEILVGGDLSNVSAAYHTAATDADGAALLIGTTVVHSNATASPKVQTSIGDIDLTEQLDNSDFSTQVDVQGSAYNLAIVENSATPEALAIAIVPIDSSDGAKANPVLDVSVGEQAQLSAGSANEFRTFVNQNALGNITDILNFAATKVAQSGANSGPVITSPANRSVNENVTQEWTITASDANGDTIAYRIIGGVDQDKFMLNNDILTFKQAPDYENPNDADGDNIYEVEVEAYDLDANGNEKGGLGSQTLRININDVANALTSGANTSAAYAATLSLSDIVSLAEEAKNRWLATGLSQAQIAALDAITYDIEDLSGGHIGVADGNTVTLDVNANGFGWFIDETPTDDAEFNALNSVVLQAKDGSEADGRVDLLTVLMHEQGHILGLADSSDEYDLMSRYLFDSSRVLPVQSQAADGSQQTATGTHFLSATELDQHTQSSGHRGATYVRTVNADAQEDTGDAAPNVRVKAELSPTINIQFGQGSLVSSANQNVVIQIDNDYQATAIGGGIDRPQPFYAIVDADAKVGGSINISLGGQIEHNGDLVLEVNNTFNAVAIGEAMAIGPVGGTGVIANAEVSTEVNTYVEPNSEINVSGDFVVRTSTEANAIAEARGIAVAGITAGASLASATLVPTINTYIGDNSYINAGGDIVVENRYNVDANGNRLGAGASAIAEASAGGLASGVGADADAISNAQIAAYVDQSASLSAGGDILITALADHTATAETQGVTVGGLAAGAALADAVSNGSTDAFLAGNVLAANNLSVIASGQHRADAYSTGFAGGVVAGAGADSNAQVSPLINAFIGSDRTINVSGQINVQAMSDAQANADAIGATGGAISVGVALAEAVLTPDVNAFIDSSTLSAAAINVSAKHNQSNGKGAKADVVAASGSLVAGVAVNEAVAESSANVESFIGGGALISTTGDIAISAAAENNAEANADGSAFGAIGVGTSFADALSQGVSRSHLDGEVNRADDVSVIATMDNTSYADGVSASAGILSGQGTIVSATDRSTTLASLGASALLHDQVAGDVNVKADATIDVDAAGKGRQPGFIGVGVTEAVVTVDNLTRAEVASGAQVLSGENFALTALSFIHADAAGTGGSGAVVDISAAHAGISVTNNTEAFIGNASKVDVVGAITILAESRHSGKASTAINNSGLGVGADSKSDYTLLANTQVWVEGGTLRADYISISADGKKTQVDAEADTHSDAAGTNSDTYAKVDTTLNAGITLSDGAQVSGFYGLNLATNQRGIDTDADAYSISNAAGGDTNADAINTLIVNSVIAAASTVTLRSRDLSVSALAQAQPRQDISAGRGGITVFEFGSE
jgi:hypothetical protein